jgi:hypothetical protein
MNQSQVLVERRLRMKKRDGSEEDLVIQIGHPYEVQSDGDAACPVEMRGLVDRVADIHGIDRLDALRLAIKFVESLVDGKAKEISFYWPDGEPYVSLKS